MRNFTPEAWIQVRRGFGAVDPATLHPNDCVTASGLHDGGYIVWRERDMTTEAECIQHCSTSIN